MEMQTCPICGFSLLYFPDFTLQEESQNTAHCPRGKHGTRNSLPISLVSVFQEFAPIEMEPLKA